MIARPLVVAIIAAACGSCMPSDDVRPADSTPLRETPRGLACTALAESVCARVEACAPFLATTGTGVGAACSSAMFDPCFRTAGLGGSTRTIADLNACAHAVRGAECSQFLTRFPDVCELPAGSLVDGTICAFDEQCASRFCDREPDTACGTCTQPPTVGERCPHDACARGLACTSAHVCAEPGELGEPCSQNQPCSRLLACSNGRCEPRKALGDPCNGVGQCGAFAETTCASNSVCRVTSIVELGEPCSLAVSELTLCRAPARCIDGRCALPRAEGEPCGAAGSHECAGFAAECIRGRCLLRTVETCQK